jgi:hypothetical protein
MSRPVRIREKIEDVFQRFVEQKWMDALNVAATEPFSWEAAGAKAYKGPGEGNRGPKEQGDRARVAMVEANSSGDRRRRSWFFGHWTAKKTHPAANCETIRGLGLKAEKGAQGE